MYKVDTYSGFIVSAAKLITTETTVIKLTSFFMPDSPIIKPRRAMEDIVASLSEMFAKKKIEHEKGKASNKSNSQL